MSKFRLGTSVLALCLAAATPLAAQADAPPADVLSALALKTCRVVTPTVGPAKTTIPAQTPSLALSLDLGGAQPATFLLDPYPLRAANFKVIVTDDTGEHEVPAPPATTFHGADTVTGDEVFASISGNLVRATIIPARPGAPLLFVQPLADAGASANGVDRALHAVYQSSEIAPLHATCGLDDCKECQSAAAAVTPSFVPRGPGTCKYVELVAESDWPFYQLNGSNVSNTVQDIEVVFLGVNALYRNTAGFVPAVRFALQRVVVRASNASDPYTAFPLPPTEADSGTMLSTCRTFWNNQSATTPDLLHLFTGRDLNGSTVGLAYVNTVCSNSRFGLAQSRFTSNLGARYQDTAHEIGHNFSFSHDDVNGTNIMNSGINPGSPATTFSSQSVSQYTAAIGAFTCLNNAPPDALPDSAAILPNQAITIDVLANDGQGVICTAPVTTFTIPSTSSAGGSVVRSVGTGPGGRDQVTYTPPSGAVGIEDTFNYTVGTQLVPVYISIVTPRPPDQPYTAVLSGLRATYYDITNPGGSVTLFSTMPDLASYPSFGTNIVSQLNYPLSSGNAVGSNRNFGMGAIFTGFIQVPTTAFYQFWTVSDDLSRFSIGNTVVLTNGAVQAVGEATGAIALAPGRHAIKVEYTNYTGNTQLVLSYAYPGQPRVTVPASALWRNAGPCHADFNGVSGTNVQDIFDFLAAWFSGFPTADFNGVNGITVQDIFDFLAVWFGPC